MTILVFVGRYLPGFRSGGPIRSISNLVECLGDELHFRVITSDRDMGDTGPYPGIERDRWVQVGKAQVMYLSPRAQRLAFLTRLMREATHDVVYLNSFFNGVFTIRPLVLRRLGRVPHRPLILAPRGELACSALGLKAFKKAAFRSIARPVALYDGVTWQATSAAEEADIRREMGGNVHVVPGPAVFSVPSATSPVLRPQHKRGSAKLVTLSRIGPVKNLHTLVPALSRVRGLVTLDLFGGVTDEVYWAKCQQAFKSLPGNVTVTYHGPIDHDLVAGVLAQSDLFVLPTLGENFCHAAAEAFSAGCPVLISDQTPWRGLQQAKAGWDLPLRQPEAFTEAIQKVINMGEEEHREWREGARSYITNHPLITGAIEANRRMFLRLLQR